jgi:segregation and condensation protein B
MPGVLLAAGAGTEVSSLTRSLEALLVVLDRPLDPAEVAESWRVANGDVRTALVELQRAYEAGDRGLRLREGASGWQLHAADDEVARVRAVVTPESTARLSAAALETLAVIAYQQPVSRSRIASIRGVNVDAVVRTLMVRGLVEATATDPTTGAALYCTTPVFLDALGLRTLDELPALPPFLPEVATVMAEHGEGSI